MPRALAAFIERWLLSSASERANKDAFLAELCLVLDVPRPNPTSGDPAKDHYVFEQKVRIRKPDGSAGTGIVDLYKEGCFVLEVMQSSDEDSRKRSPRRRTEQPWNNAMERARTRAVELAANLDPRPPFVIVCDVGRCFDLYACFDGTSRYRPFPNPEKKRLPFDRLADHAETLRTVWTEPLRLDPSKRSERVSEEAAACLAVIAGELEAAGHPPEAVADFLLRCVFTMFAEDVGLLGQGLFSSALETFWIPLPTSFPAAIEALWRAMNDGSPVGLGSAPLRFNGGLFEKPRALPLTAEQLRHLLRAAGYDWSDVDPAIFGALIERALNPRTRAAIGAPVTPRVHVERLVQPTIDEPLRGDWDLVRAEVWLHGEQGKPEAAKKALRDFQARLSNVRVLDPACGTGGFLCVALSLLQQIESEVTAELRALGDTHEPHTRVSPAQMRGIDVSRQAQTVAALMLWLGYFQGHYRTHGRQPTTPQALPGLHTIEARDALLAWDTLAPVLDGKGKPVTRWDGTTMKRSPVTGDPVPDERAQAVIEQYVNPRRTMWPTADFIVGNPPFIAGERMRQSLGEGYVAALRATYPEVPELVDYAMYWWDRAACLAREGAIRRFGFVMPNSITQAPQRRVLAGHLGARARPLRIAFSIPDHPWVDAKTGTTVRVALTVAQRASDSASIGAVPGALDGPQDSLSYRDVPGIGSDLRSSALVEAAVPLAANSSLCARGIWPHGSGFVLAGNDQPAETPILNPMTSMPVVRPYLNGRDVMARLGNARIIDFFGLDRDQAARLSPVHFRRVKDLVKPERAGDRRANVREQWWRFGNDARGWRAACSGLTRYIATSEIAKHRVFVFLDRIVLPGPTITAVALDDAHFLGVLSSRVHTIWALATGGRLASSSRYGKAACFDPFPFPACIESQRQHLRELGEALDSHRKHRLAANPTLTLTGMYNVLEKLRSGDQLDDKDLVLRTKGRVSVLKQIHDDLDRAVLDAYGWPAESTDEQILEKLVALNQERSNEEGNGLIRWPRPDFQTSTVAGAHAPRQGSTAGTEQDGEDIEPTGVASRALLVWPKSPSQQLIAVRDLLASSKHLWSAAEVAAVFTGAKTRAVAAVLDALTGVGVLAACGASDTEQRWATAGRAGM